MDAKYSRYDQIDGRIELDTQHIKERLRAEAMKRIREKYPDHPDEWHKHQVNNFIMQTRSGGISEVTGDLILTVYLREPEGTIWAQARYEVIV